MKKRVKQIEGLRFAPANEKKVAVQTISAWNETK